MSMSINNQDLEARIKINYAKNELRNYMYLLNVCRGFEDKIIKIETALEGVRSPSAPIVIGSSSGEDKEYRRAELLEKLQRAQMEYSVFRHRADIVVNFLDSLSQVDRRIVTDIYINNHSIERVAGKVSRSVRALKYDIDEIMLKF